MFDAAMPHCLVMQNETNPLPKGIRFSHVTVGQTLSYTVRVIGITADGLKYRLRPSDRVQHLPFSPFKNLPKAVIEIAKVHTGRLIF